MVTNECDINKFADDTKIEQVIKTEDDKNLQNGINQLFKWSDTGPTVPGYTKYKTKNSNSIKKQIHNQR